MVKHECVSWPEVVGTRLILSLSSDKYSWWFTQKCCILAWFTTLSWNDAHATRHLFLSPGVFSIIILLCLADTYSFILWYLSFNHGTFNDCVGFLLQQGSHISGKNGRIHCSLNINTETGRLSARRPNLQVFNLSSKNLILLKLLY